MEDLPKTSYYKTLGVPKDATLATIRSAYRKLVLSCHPDKTQDEAEKAIRQEKFHEVQEAYENLSDESKRHKYDEKVKLAELRAERSTTRRTDDYYGASRTGVPPRYDIYDGVKYEVRVPPSQPRTYDRDTYTAEYPEDRRPAGKYDDHYSSRRTSGRASEDKRRTREVEEERERERRRKERDREAYARESRKRDKDRKKDYEAKSSRKFSAHVDDEDSDSELDDQYYKTKREPAPKARYEEPRKRSGDEGQRKSNKRDSKEYADSDLELKTGAVKDYIKNNKSREAVEPEPSRRPTHTRTTSKLENRTPQPPPPPSYPIADSAKRSSGRGRGGSRAASPIRSKKERRAPEIVETSSRGKNNVSSTSSAAKEMKSFISASSTGRGPPHRAATYQDTTQYRPKPLQRSETMPVDRMNRGGTRPLQTSTLKNMKASSDYSGSSSESESEVTEEIYPKPRRPSPRHQKSTSYRYMEDEGDRFVLEPEETPARRSEDSYQRRPSLPLRGSTARAPTTGRSMPYVSDERLPRPNYTRTESARAPPSKAQPSSKLYREYSPPPEDSQRAKHSSPKVYTDEVRHADKYARRGSEDPGYRDAWPGKFRRPDMHHRNGTTVV